MQCALQLTAADSESPWLFAGRICESTVLQIANILVKKITSFSGILHHCYNHCYAKKDGFILFESAN